MSSFRNSLEVQYAGFVGKPTGKQLYDLLELLTIEDNVILVSAKALPLQLEKLVIRAGLGISIKEDLINHIDSLYVFNNPNIDDLLAADKKNIPIYDSKILCAA